MTREPSSKDLLQTIADTLRCLAMDAVERAASGHPGMPMGCAEMAALLWAKWLRYDPAAPDWPDRDRFVLSAGHGSMLLYGVLHLAGYAITLEDLKRFRQWGSPTPGHPEAGCAPGVETTSGPLGQGFANGVGMALAEAMLAARFNGEGITVVDHYTYGIVSDGDLMEGVSHEAASLAGHLGLGKLIYLYDDNRITIDGPTDLAYRDDVARRFEGYRWHVCTADGHDFDALDAALAKARAERDRPSLVIARTHIAKGSPNKQDTAAAHGAPLGEEEVRRTKEAMGWPADAPFHVPGEVRAYFAERAEELGAVRRDWEARLKALEEARPDMARKWSDFLERRLPEDLEARLPAFEAGASVPTRSASGKVLNRIAGAVENLVGGSADLAPSNKTFIAEAGTVGPGRFEGRNFHFGVREHAMGAVMNGLALHGGFIPYGGTFLVFSDYMRPAMRMAALSRLPVIYVFTHDSIFVGEDGPTHQPVEHLAALRALPGLVVIRPADAVETAAAWEVALRRREGPTALVLSRQGLPVIDRVRYAPPEVERGAYCLKREGRDRLDLVLLGTGSEVSIVLEAAERLEGEGRSVRVVSMPSWELFESQPEAYRCSLIPPEGRRRLAVEAGVSMGWERYVGREGRVLAMDRFGASAPARVLQEKFGFTAERIVEEARALLGS